MTWPDLLLVGLAGVWAGFINTVVGSGTLITFPVLLALGVGVPVVPAAIIGGYEAMPKGRSWPVPGRPPVRVVFGEPLLGGVDESAGDFITRIRDSVKDLYDEHHDEVLGSAVRDEEEDA